MGETVLGRSQAWVSDRLARAVRSGVPDDETILVAWVHSSVLTHSGSGGDAGRRGGTLIPLKIVDAAIGLRVGEEEEVRGPDPSQHGERAYSL